MEEDKITFTEFKTDNNFYENKKEYKSILKIGDDNYIKIYNTSKFNKLQKKLWKWLFNITIEDYKE